MKRARKSAVDKEDALAVAAATIAWFTFLSILPVVQSSDCSALFGCGGRYRAINSNGSYASIVPLQPCNKLCCSALCAADDLCFGANYRDDSSQCILLRFANWQLEPDGRFTLLLKANGRYRILPGAFPRPSVIPSYNVTNILDSQRCQQLCESQPAVCSLFAYNAVLSLCYIFSGDFSPSLLSFGFTASTWTSYYRFRQGSAVQECSTRYYFVSQSFDRDAAEQYCISSYGARLVQIDSTDEHTFLTAVIKSTSALVNKTFWLGAKSTMYPYDFRWSCSGNNLTYTAWSSSEPNFQDEFCVHMRSDFMWNNIICTPWTLPSICEECHSAKCSG